MDGGDGRRLCVPGWVEEVEEADTEAGRGACC